MNALEDSISAYAPIQLDLNDIMTLLREHGKRVYPVNDLQLPPVMDALSAETLNPEHFYFAYLPDEQAWGDRTLVQADDAEGGATAVVYLQWLVDYAHGSVTGTGPDGLPDPAPLLFQLIKRAVDRANKWDNDSLIDFDHFLGDINSASRLASPADQIGAVKRLSGSLAKNADLLDQALKQPANAPLRQAVSGVPRTMFQTASSQLRAFQRVTQSQSPDLSRAIGLLDQWAQQPGNAKATPNWGGTSYVPTVPGARLNQLANAIGALVDLPPDDLELRMKETLGLAMHRLDAWISSYAEDRVVAMRDSQPQGVQIGGYGWVENLRPDQAGTLPSQGYLHAPSMTQAAAAAVLRSGYSAYSDGTSTSPLSVDLRSDRVRVARWMMDGLRQGQRINDLLGYRFERALHDAYLDVWIDPVRDAVANSGASDLTDTVTVDGLALLNLWDEGSGSLESLVAVPSGHSFDEIEDALNQLVWITDAMADLTLAESVHALVQGDYDRASAVENAASLGDVAPPEVRSVLTPNSGMSITQRILLLPQDAGSGWDDQGMSVRRAYESALELVGGGRAWRAGSSDLPDHDGGGSQHGAFAS